MALLTCRLHLSKGQLIDVEASATDRRPERGNRVRLRREGTILPTDPAAAVERFYEGLAGLGPREWVSIVAAFPIVEYEAASEFGRAAIGAFALAPSDPAAATALNGVQREAEQVATDLIPTLDFLRAEGVGELSEEGYQHVKLEAARRVLRAASGVALAQHLSPAALSGLYQPFEGFIPLSAVLLGPPPGSETTTPVPAEPPSAPRAMDDTTVRVRSKSSALVEGDALLDREQREWAGRKRATIAWAVVYGAISLVGLWLGWWASAMFWAIAAFLGLGVAYGIVNTLSLARRRGVEARIAAELPIDSGFLVEAAPGMSCVNCGAPATHALPIEVTVNYCRTHASRFVRLALIAGRD